MLPCFFSILVQLPMPVLKLSKVGLLLGLLGVAENRNVYTFSGFAMLSLLISRPAGTFSV